jgi:uncharacterized protein YegL
MAFDPSKYKTPSAKPLPVVLLLDVSGSMFGEKINKLHDATVEMVNSFIEEATKETIINIAIITFGARVDLHTAYTPVTDLQKKGITGFCAEGQTPLGTALTMAKDMIEDKGVTPSNAYRPAIVLVSDGAPNDEWRTPLSEFIGNGRSAKCQRFAIAVGNDADRNMLEQFTGDSSTVFFAEEASDIANNFKKVTMSVSMRSKSVNPNAVPLAQGSFDKPNTDVSSNDNDDDEF